jgi:hypothetical protein
VQRRGHTRRRDLHGTGVVLRLLHSRRCLHTPELLQQLRAGLPASVASAATRHTAFPCLAPPAGAAHFWRLQLDLSGDGQLLQPFLQALPCPVPGR